MEVIQKMATITKKQNPLGLDLAYSHSSAVGKVRVDQVYENIEKSKTIQKDSVEDRASAQALGVRSIVDRLERLGQRYLENKNVAPADHIRMSKEFEVLKQDLQDLMAPSMPTIEFPALKDLKLEKWTPDLAARLADAIFAGEVKAKDEVNMLGKVVDPEANPLQINLKGRLRLSTDSANKPFDTIKYLTDRQTYPLQNDPSYPTAEWIATTAQSVRTYVLENAASAPKIHGHLSAQDPILKISV